MFRATEHRSPQEDDIELRAAGPSTVGLRIKAVRTDRELSLRALSTASGVSVGMLSQVERGLTDPSMQTLRSVAKALDVPLFDLFQEPEGQDIAVVRRHRRVSLSAPHAEITYSRISPGSGRLEVLEGTLLPGGVSAETPWRHASEECVVVTAGVLTVEVGGEVHHLEVGDSCYFDSRLGHRYVNDGAEPAVFLVSITPPSY